MLRMLQRWGEISYGAAKKEGIILKIMWSIYDPCKNDWGCPILFNGYMNYLIQFSLGTLREKDCNAFLNETATVISDGREEIKIKQFDPCCSIDYKIGWREEKWTDDLRIFFIACLVPLNLSIFVRPFCL